jgi:hypothetical protein
MGLLGKLFFPDKEEEEYVVTKFGRYSDNNKTKEQLDQWKEAKILFDEKKYIDALALFFDYLKDTTIENVTFTRNGDNAQFEVYQGSKKIEGSISDISFKAAVPIAEMSNRTIPVLRKLLEKNYSLYYSKFFLEENKLCLHIYNDLRAATPEKLYYALKEIALNADRLDDILVDDFANLKAVGTGHIKANDDKIKQIKYDFFKYWVDKTLAKIEALNPDTFAGGIAYMLLNLVYKMDYLLLPEGKLTESLEEINSLFWNNLKEMPAVERNNRMYYKLKELSQWDEAEVKKYFYKTKHTFSITKPTGFNNVIGTIQETMKNVQWFQENNHLDIALEMLEYAFAYSQFSFSLPKPATQLFDVVMQVNHNDYYQAMGHTEQLYNRKSKTFNDDEIRDKIEEIVDVNKSRYPHLKIDAKAISFESLQVFNQSILSELVKLDLRRK